MYALELNTTVDIKEWNKDIRIMLDEASFFSDDFFEYVSERQVAIKPIKIQ